MNELILLLQLVLSLLVIIQQNPSLSPEFKSQVMVLSQSAMQAAEKYLEEQTTQQLSPVPATVPAPPPVETIPAPVFTEIVSVPATPEPIVQKTMNIKLEKVNNSDTVLKGDQTRVKLFQLNIPEMNRMYNTEVVLESNVPLYLPRVNEVTLEKTGNYTYSKIINYTNDRFIVSNIVPKTEWTEIDLILTIKSGTFDQCPANEVCTFPELPLSNSVKLIKN